MCLYLCVCVACVRERIYIISRNSPSHSLFTVPHVIRNKDHLPSGLGSSTRAWSDARSPSRRSAAPTCTVKSAAISRSCVGQQDGGLSRHPILKWGKLDTHSKQNVKCIYVHTTSYYIFTHTLRSLLFMVTIFCELAV